MLNGVVQFLTVLGEGVNRVLARKWGNQTSAEASTSDAIATLERDWREAVDRGDLVRANAVRHDLIVLLNKTVAQRIAD